MKRLLFLPCLLLALAGCAESEATVQTFDSNEDPAIADEGQTVAMEEKNATNENVADILEGKEYVPGPMEHPNDYKPFPAEVQSDLEKLPEDVQEYLLVSASIHVLEPFVNDPNARAILIEASELIPDFNANDVDALIANGEESDRTYEQRLKELLNYSN